MLISRHASILNGPSIEQIQPKCGPNISWLLKMGSLKQNEPTIEDQISQSKVVSPHNRSLLLLAVPFLGQRMPRWRHTWGFVLVTYLYLRRGLIVEKANFLGITKRCLGPFYWLRSLNITYNKVIVNFIAMPFFSIWYDVIIEVNMNEDLHMHKTNILRTCPSKEIITNWLVASHYLGKHILIIAIPSASLSRGIKSNDPV